MATRHRARAVLKILDDNTGSVTGRANAICAGLDANAAIFANPNPTTKVLRDQIDALTKAEVVAAGRAPGAAAARNVVRNILVASMRKALAYVQEIADHTEPLSVCPL